MAKQTKKHEHNSLSKRTSVMVLGFVGLLVYGNSLLNGFFVGDDEVQIVDHQLVHSITSIPALFTGSTYFQEYSSQAYGLFYRPLMLTSFALLYAVNGPDPLVFHLASLCLHIANAVLVFLLLDELIRKRKAALFAAGLFLVHPIQSEVVFHASNLQEGLFFLFGMAGLLVVIRRSLTWKTVLGLIGLFCLSLLGKETGGLFLLMAVVYAYLLDRSKIKSVVTASVVGVGLYSWLRFYVAGVGFTKTTVSLITQAPLPLRLLTIPKLVFTYLGLFVVPVRLQAFRFWLVTEANMQSFWLPLLVMAVVVGMTVWVARRVQLPSREKKLQAFFAIWLGSGLLLHLQLVPLDMVLAERWFYFPMVGLVGMGLILFGSVGRRIAKPVPWLAIGLVWLCVLGIRTVQRSFDWRSSERLLQVELSDAQTGDYFAQNLLATLYIRDKKFEAAKPLLTDSLAEYPFIGSLNNMAIVMLSEKNYPEAERYFKESMEKGLSYPVMLTYVNYLLYLKQDFGAARELALQGVTAYPKSGEMWLAVAQSEYWLGNGDTALYAARRAVELFPSPVSKYVLKTIQEEEKLAVDEYLEL